LLQYTRCVVVWAPFGPRRDADVPPGSICPRRRPFRPEQSKAETDALKVAIGAGRTGTLVAHVLHPVEP